VKFYKFYFSLSFTLYLAPALPALPCPRSSSEFFFGLRAYNYFTTHTLLNNHSCLLAKAADTNLATTYFFA
jgi:hypothetical protein